MISRTTYRRIRSQFLAIRFAVSALLMTLATAVVPSQQAAAARPDIDLEVERQMLIQLLDEGHYRRGIEETVRLEDLLRPQRREPDYAVRMTALVEMLIYRGILQTRMGAIDDAETSLRDAYRRLTDRELQRLAGQEGKAVLELLYIEIADAVSQVTVDKIRRANETYRVRSDIELGRKPQSSSDEDDLEAIPPASDVESWIKQLDELVQQSFAARGAMGKNVSSLKSASDSPRVQLMATTARPRMFAGIREIEASKLPWTVADGFSEDGEQDAVSTSTNSSETTAQRLRSASRQRSRGLAYLEQAKADQVDCLGEPELPVDERQAEATPPAPAKPTIINFRTGTTVTGGSSSTSSQGNNTSSLAESASLHAELLECFAEAHFLERDLSAARDAIDAALFLRRKARESEHPELARPSILSAEIAMLEADTALKSRNPRIAKEKTEHAVEGLQLAKTLLEAQDSEFDPSSPLHDLLAHLLNTGEQQQEESRDAVAANDAADAAASRALSAIRRQEEASQR